MLSKDTLFQIYEISMEKSMVISIALVLALISAFRVETEDFYVLVVFHVIYLFRVAIMLTTS